jgi:hypothetical protein
MPAGAHREAAIASPAHGPRETMVAANKAARICLSRKEATDLALLLITAARK